MEKLKRRQFLKMAGGSVLAAALPVSKYCEGGIVSPEFVLLHPTLGMMRFKQKLKEAEYAIMKFSTKVKESSISMEIFGEQLYGGQKVKLGSLALNDPDSFVTIDKPMRNITGVISQAGSLGDCEISIGNNGN